MVNLMPFGHLGRSDKIRSAAGFKRLAGRARAETRLLSYSLVHTVWVIQQLREAFPYDSASTA